MLTRLRNPYGEIQPIWWRLCRSAQQGNQGKFSVGQPCWLRGQHRHRVAFKFETLLNSRSTWSRQIITSHQRRKMEGHAKVAQLMSRYPELAIVRRFGHLNMQNLLYLQAELVHLEAEYRLLAEQSQLNPDRLDHAKDWFSLSQSDDMPEHQQWGKILDIRKKLKEYSMWYGLIFPILCLFCCIQSSSANDGFRWMLRSSSADGPARGPKSVRSTISSELVWTTKNGEFSNFGPWSGCLGCFERERPCCCSQKAKWRSFHPVVRRFMRPTFPPIVWKTLQGTRRYRLQVTQGLRVYLESAHRRTGVWDIAIFGCTFKGSCSYFGHSTGVLATNFFNSHSVLCIQSGGTARDYSCFHSTFLLCVGFDNPSKADWNLCWNICVRFLLLANDVIIS